jgi:hypothetical protein
VLKGVVDADVEGPRNTSETVPLTAVPFVRSTVSGKAWVDATAAKLTVLELPVTVKVSDPEPAVNVVEEAVAFTVSAPDPAVTESFDPEMMTV